jgi:hypothetical protein
VRSGGMTRLGVEEGEGEEASWTSRDLGLTRAVTARAYDEGKTNSEAA